MDGLMLLAGALAVLSGFAAVAVAFGAESRDDFTERVARRRGA
jgi:hypothetical protein